jgi:two-component system, LytTR family, response regulator
MTDAPIQCMIVDDEEHAVTSLSRLVNKTPFLKLVHATTSPVEGLQLLLRQPVQLVFLDIRMPDLSGLEFIKAAPRNLEFILCTAFHDHALESYEYGVIDYLLKPVEYPRFLTAVQKAIERIHAKPEPIRPTGDSLQVKTDAGQMKLPFGNIIFIESLKNYISIQCTDGKHLVRASISSVESELPKSYFFRVHNSFLVNKKYVTGIKGNSLLLNAVPDTIPIGITYRQTVNEFFKSEGRQE